MNPLLKGRLGKEVMLTDSGEASNVQGPFEKFMDWQQCTTVMHPPT